MATIKDMLEGRETDSNDTVETVETVEAETPAPEAGTAESDGGEAPTEEKTENGVPVAALQAERRKYKENLAAVESKLAEQDARWQQRFEQLIETMKPKAQPEAPPDFWESPESAIDYRLQQMVTPLQRQLAQQREEFSMMQAVAAYGQDTVNDAFEDLKRRVMSQAPEAQAHYQQIMSSAHPYGALVDWHKKQKAIDEIGSDPNAYREKLKAEILAEMQSKPETSSPTAPVMPGNFTGGRNVGSRSGPAWAGPSSINDIFALDRNRAG